MLIFYLQSATLFITIVQHKCFFCEFYGFSQAVSLLKTSVQYNCFLVNFQNIFQAATSLKNENLAQMFSFKFFNFLTLLRGKGGRSTNSLLRRGKVSLPSLNSFCCSGVKNIENGKEVFQSFFIS